ncbi:histone deacetylase [Streptomyces sp. ST2-7A]|nr:histone deacetylase [Streptomyces sp. ST2-7A]
MSPVDRLWYAAYGSNTHPARLALYLRGGVHPDGGREYPGCRDPRPPERSVPLWLPGSLYFATLSPVWRGGRAFYDPDTPGPAAARGHLLRPGQFADLLAQEMYREPGTEPVPDLHGLLTAGRLRVGPGRYETLVLAGELDGFPVVTFTAPWRSDEVPSVAPAPAYLWRIGAGLREANDWTAERAADALAGSPGVAGHWTRDALAALIAGPPPDAPPPDLPPGPGR